MSDVSALQIQLEDIKKRLAELEKAESQAIGPRGARGAPGLIGLAGLNGDRGPQGQTGPVGRDGSNGQDGRDGRTPGKEDLESIVVTLLNEYHLLDAETGLPHAGPYAAAKKD